MSPSDGEPRRRRALPLCGLVAAITFLAHSPGWMASDATFVYDDDRFVLHNEHVQVLHAPWTYLRPETAGDRGAEGIWRPARTLLFALEWSVFGDQVRGWRIVGVVLHAGAAGLAALVMLSLVGDRAAAAIGSLAFALHPLTAEVSSWVSSQGDALALIGFLAAIAFHLRGRTVATLAAAALALLAKEMAVTLPLVLLALDLARGRVREGRGRTIGTGAVVVAYVGVRLLVLGGGDFGQPGLDEATWSLTRAMGILRDARVALFPVALGFDLHLEWAGSAAHWLAATGGVAVLLALAGASFVLARRGRPLVAAGLAWTLVALGPTITPFFPLLIATADRFLVFSLAGLGLVVAAAVARRGPRVRLAAGAALLILAVLAGRRTLVYANDESLWTEAARTDPSNHRALEGLAAAAYRRGDLREAERRYDAFLAVRDDDAKARYFSGLVKIELGARLDDGARYREGHEELRRAVEGWSSGRPEGRPLRARACLRLAKMEIARGELAVAEAYARDALADPRARDVDRAQAETILADLILIRLEKNDDAGAGTVVRGWLQANPARSAAELRDRIVERARMIRSQVPEARIRALREEPVR